MIEINLAKIKSFRDKSTVDRLNHHMAVNGLGNFYTAGQICISTGASRMAAGLMLQSAAIAGCMRMGMAVYDKRDLTVPFFIGIEMPDFPTINPNTDEEINSEDDTAIEYVWFFTDKAKRDGVRFVCRLPELKDVFILDYLEFVSA